MLRMASEQESRLLARIGLALLLIVAAGITVAIADPWGRPPDARTALTVDTPFVGQGVAGGTPVLLNGVRVGAVDTVASRTEGGVRLELRLDRESTAGLTDTVGVDFRPSNYFGVTGVNLIHGPPGGQALRDGMRVALVPRGNYTMQALLSRMADFTGGVITEELVRVLQRATQFADALNPMIETMLVVANSVLKAQTVSAGQFVRNTAAIGVVAPAFVDGLTDLVDRVDHSGLDVDEEFFEQRLLPTVELASKGMFAAIGRLLSSHVRELLPVTEVIRSMTGPIPGIAQTHNISESLEELRARFERMYEGAHDQRALQVHIVLDSIPGIAAPLGALGIPR